MEAARRGAGGGRGREPQDTEEATSRCPVYHSPNPSTFPSRTLLGHHCNSGQNCKAIMHPGIYLLIIPRKPVFFSVTRMLIQSNFKDNWRVWGGVDHRSLGSSRHSTELIEDGRKENQTQANCLMPLFLILIRLRFPLLWEKFLN